MQKLTVSAAARAVGVSRQYLYKAYINTGKVVPRHFKWVA
jgi:DNA-binding phage protein